MFQFKRNRDFLLGIVMNQPCRFINEESEMVKNKNKLILPFHFRDTNRYIYINTL